MRKRGLMTSTCLPIGTVKRAIQSDPRQKVVGGLNDPRLTLQAPVIDYFKGDDDAGK